ncbi:MULTISPECIES: phage replisome organizer N-terminal domain-containing protein [Vagococcus]|uniref:phage replisome organizer N-terminal domain-containing protein n=1 Tax=Vagococcus TaxID=2737 RepID=UPI00288D3AC9|nr:phage replisome organizer N-terminal domain-containing protein [Vagococcus carniphilus]MDT2831882.1 phage replisome organizer N-terminal domain-containing protein [Vagococcus carniphilus]MDT2855392.1 phage replisome organizer N-terminal domain-containing protein [Vagococcus carniphilus]WNF89827.1 phage replisome organizer N-terminal domain-containing protein [Vagococcus fluvialis]
MSDNKKYYYLKLKDNFFDDEAMILLESMPDGYKYSTILLKMYLRSLKYDGKLMFNDMIPYTSSVLAKILRHTQEDVEGAIKMFQSLGLVEVLETGEIYMLDIQNFIGASSTEADRIREYRSKIAAEKENVQMSQQKSLQMYDKSTPEKEIKKELKKEKELKSDKKKKEPSSSDDNVSLKNRFEEIWEQYPTGRKQGKDKAFNSYKKAIKDGVTDEVISNGINAYKKQIKLQKTDIQYIKQGSTWFNGKCWDDEYITTNNSSSNKPDYVVVPPEWREMYEDVGKMPEPKEDYDIEDLPF